MPAVGVVEPLDVVEQREPGGAPRGEAVTGEQFAFERGEEALGRRIVEAIATTAHGTDESGFAQPPSEGQAGVLASLVRVMDDALRWPASPDRHVDGFDDQLAAEMIGHRPADDAPAVDVEHHRQIEEPRPGRDIGDVGDP